MHRKNNIEELEKTIVASHTTQDDTELKLKEDVVHKEELAARQKNFLQTENLWRKK